MDKLNQDLYVSVWKKGWAQPGYTNFKLPARNGVRAQKLHRIEEEIAVIKKTTYLLQMGQVLIPGQMN